VADRPLAAANLKINGQSMHMDLPGYPTEHLDSGGFSYGCSDRALTVQFQDMGALRRPPMTWKYKRQK
jgi:hypothetical protein